METIDGQKFGRLTAVRLHHKDERGMVYYEFLCDCGTVKVMQVYAPLRGAVKSCGCYNRELNHLRLIERNTTHGLRRHPIYQIWAHAKGRIFNPNNERYPTYGGRGIQFHEPWVEDFPAFLAHVEKLENYGRRAEGWSIDRVDVNGNYEPGNLRWASPEMQMNNTTRTVRFTDAAGVTKSSGDWSKELGIDPRTLNRRRQMGWSDEKILSTPLRRKW